VNIHEGVEWMTAAEMAKEFLSGRISGTEEYDDETR
jgi:hypothetical protein